MYVSEKAKDDLRRSQGESMEINALEVYQPINPGDGRIGKYKIIGPAKLKRDWIKLEGLVLTARAYLGNENSPAVMVELRNDGSEPLKLVSSELGFALLAKKDKKEHHWSLPSDGPSFTLITRASFGRSMWEGGGFDAGQSYSWTIGQDNALPECFELEPGQSRTILVSFRLPAEEYDFLCGYGVEFTKKRDWQVTL